MRPSEIAVIVVALAASFRDVLPAANASSRPESGSSASASPVAGLVTRIVLPLAAPTHAPPTYICERSPTTLMLCHLFAVQGNSVGSRRGAAYPVGLWCCQIVQVV